MAIKVFGPGTSTELNMVASGIAPLMYYEASGDVSFPNVSFAGIAEVEVRQSAITNPGTVVWAIHNPTSDRKILVTKIYLDCFFDGTAVATNMNYEVIKCRGATSVTGGTVVTPMAREETKKSFAIVRVGDTGLTILSGTFYFDGGSELNIAMGRVTQTALAFVHNSILYDNTSLQARPIVLLENELLAIRPPVTTVVGDNVMGYVQYKEVST